MSATGMFRLHKIFSDLTKLQRSCDEKLASPRGCLFSVTHSMSTVHTPLSANRYNVNSKVRQENYFSARSMDRENFARFLYQNFDFQRFQAAGIGPYMSLLTDEQEQRRSSFISHIFPSQIINKEPSSRSISPVPTSSIADASAAEAQKKKQYETLTKEEEKYLVNLWVEYYDRLESKDLRKYWDIITREVNEKFGKN